MMVYHKDLFLMVNQIASIDYYPTAGQEFYVDDICLEYTAPQLTL